MILQHVWIRSKAQICNHISLSHISVPVEMSLQVSQRGEHVSNTLQDNNSRFAPTNLFIFGNGHRGLVSSPAAKAIAWATMSTSIDFQSRLIGAYVNYRKLERAVECPPNFSVKWSVRWSVWESSADSTAAPRICVSKTVGRAARRLWSWRRKALPWIQFASVS